MTGKLPLVFVHVHYPDVWAEMARELAAAFERPFGLVLTCRDPSMPLAGVESPHLAFTRRLDTENRGRDVLPFLRALAGEADFEIGLKLHSKRSTHREDGSDWRRFLTSSLLRKDGSGPAALGLMEREPRIGLVAPEAHLLPLQGRIVLNAWIARRMIQAMRLPLTLRELETGHFAAGSMFWFRREALLPLADPALHRLFASEKAQLDGTAAHAAERLFAAVAERQGFVATATEAVPALQALIAEQAGPIAIDEIRRVSEREIARANNPFVLPIPAFWRRHPYLLLLAHHAYTRSPPGLWRFARKSLKRFTVDR